MTSMALATVPQPIEALNAKPTDDKPKRLRVGRKLRHVLDLIVFDGLKMDEAARTAGTSTRVVRRALERRHVVAHLRQRQQVFRASISAGNSRRLEELRDQNSNMMAAIAAIKTLERMDDDEPERAAQRSVAPGFVIVINNGSAHMTQMRESEAKPLIEQDNGGDR